MRFCFSAVLALFVVNFSYSQGEYSSFTATGRGGATTFVTDYQSLGINPSNLGWTTKYKGQNFTMGYSEFAFSVYSEALTKPELRESVYSMLKIGKEDSEKLTMDDKLRLAQSFTDTELGFNMDIGVLGMAYTSDKFGGLGFSMSNHARMNMKLNQTVSELMFLGYNASYFDSLTLSNWEGTAFIPNTTSLDPDSMAMIVNGFTNVPSTITQILDGTDVNISVTTEYNLSYGRKIIDIDSTFAVYGGFGIKYIQGLAMVDFHTDDDGTFNGYTSISPIIPFDSLIGVSSPSSVLQKGILPTPVGGGFGFDFGATVIFGNKLKLGLAVTNIGKMKWKGNVYSVQDTLLTNIESGGVESLNLAKQLGDFSGSGMLNMEKAEDQTYSLPTTMRMGASVMLGKKVELGMDMIIPMNDAIGNFERAIIGIGGDVMPIRWLRFSLGAIKGGTHKISVPVGITLIGNQGAWEGGIASRDAYTFFSDNGSTLSFAFGFFEI